MGKMMMETTTVLDDVERIRSVDPGNMYNRIFDFPEQLADALRIAQRWQINARDFAGIKNVVLIGMGGSAIGGDIVRSYVSSKLLVPFQVCRHYVLPEYVDDETLVIASSYSGNTEETLAALDDALGRKAMVVAMTTGGLLKDVAELNDIPIAILPPGLQPRAALGYSLVPLLVFMEKIKLIGNVTKEIKEVIAKLQDYREKYIEDNPVLHNPAKNIAQRIYGKIPIIYSGPTLTDAVALRWKGQICENAKNLAFANHFPEFNHNELVGWSETIEAYKDRLAVIVLRDADDHPQVRKRMNIVEGIIKELSVEVIEAHSRGTLPLERILSLVQLGDFVSYYLAVLNNVDPTPVKVIDFLKKELQERK
jgi:glucose/mannose-6-phosphate isomerase